eukprot:8996791-Pyramimonas_sp.AAC.1
MEEDVSANVLALSRPARPTSSYTRVMSPTSLQCVEFLSTYRGFQCDCPKCHTMVTDPVTCSQC